MAVEVHWLHYVYSLGSVIFFFFLLSMNQWFSWNTASYTSVKYLLFGK